MSPENESKGFFQYGNSNTNLDYEYEDALVGDREGLIYLRDKIDEALATDEEICFSDDDIINDFTYIKYGERDLSAVDGDNEDNIWKFGCLTIIVILMALIVLGAIKAYDMITL